MAASESTLGLLHEMVAQHLIDKLGTDDVSAADITAALRMLKDNNITAVADKGSALDELRQRLQSKNSLSPATMQELEEGVESMDWATNK